MKIDISKFSLHPLSYGDPNGSVFQHDDELYRVISEDQIDFYLELFERGIIDELIDKKCLIPSTIADVNIEEKWLVIRHESVAFPSYCFEWCGEMLKEAARVVLKLEQNLLRHGLTLTDPHPVNVLFQGVKPFWVDFGSLARVGAPNAGWSSEMFAAHFTRPLKIMSAGHDRLARCLLYEANLNGVSQREAEAITDGSWIRVRKAVKTRAGNVVRRVVPIPMRPLARRAKRLLAHSRDYSSINSKISSETKEIESIKLPQPTTRWSDYDNVWFPPFDSHRDWTEKHFVIEQILAEKRPRTVLDLGANRGWYSQLAARHGALVVALDSDSPAIGKLYRDARRDGLSILPLIHDFRSLHPTVPLGRTPGVPPWERFRCDMVFALALVHHLVFTNSLTFDYVVKVFSSFTDKWLVTEFVGREDRHIPDWVDGWPPWYSLDNFISAIKKEFKIVEVLPSNEDHRRLLLCSR